VTPANPPSPIALAPRKRHRRIMSILLRTPGAPSPSQRAPSPGGADPRKRSQCFKNRQRERILSNFIKNGGHPNRKRETDRGRGTMQAFVFVSCITYVQRTSVCLTAEDGSHPLSLLASDQSPCLQEPSAAMKSTFFQWKINPRLVTSEPSEVTFCPSFCLTGVTSPFPQESYSS
jgi:hypothetical protein